MKKSILSLLLSLLAALNTYAFNATINGIYYELSGTEAIVTSFSYTVANTPRNKTYSGKIIIPRTVNYEGKTYTVTSIGKKAFHHSKSLTSVVIPESVTKIDEFAFSFCSSLTSVTIPNSVTEIGNSAFNECSSLTSITIPESVTKIGFFAFNNCKSLCHIYSRSSTPPACSRDTFKNIDTNKAILHVPTGAKTKYASAQEWRTIKNIIVDDAGNINYSQNTGSNKAILHSPADAKAEYTSAQEWQNRTNSIVGDAVNINGIYYEFIKNDAIVTHGSTEYSGGITIPSTVEYKGNTYTTTSIGNSAFENCSTLTSVVIPKTVTSIGFMAFRGCKSLQDIYVLNTTPPTCGNWAFDSINIDQVILHVKSGAEAKYTKETQWSIFRNIIKDAK